MGSRQTKRYCFPATGMLETPVGNLRLGADADGLAMLLFPNATDEIAGEGTHSGEAQAHLNEAIRALTEYFDGGRKDFDGLTLSPRGTAFQKAVWQQLARIPFGVTRSYRQIAEAIGNPKAVRAVGLANGRNPIPVIVPCHRVIGADGSLTGFGGGLETKKWLLAHEGIAPRNLL